MKRKLAIICALMLVLAVLTGCMSPNNSLNLNGTQSTEQASQPSNLPSAEQGTQPSDPSVPGEISNLKINSLDKLNYYAALRMIAETPMVSKQSMTGGSYGIVLLAGSVGDDSEEAPIAPDDPDTTNPGKDIIYYQLNPNQPFNMKKVNMFQIELTDENGFLASKLGLGLIDVVITENCIWGDSLITFRNGDKFFSCLTNGYGQNPQTGDRYWEFSTHKYVEGFNIVKNFQQENYAFYVNADAEGQIFAFECRQRQGGDEGADQNVRIVSTTRISTQGGEFTIAELEAYFNNGNTV